MIDVHFNTVNVSAIGSRVLDRSAIEPFDLVSMLVGHELNYIFFLIIQGYVNSTVNIML